MRDAALAIIREIGVDTGGSNIQFAVHPDDRPPGRHRDEPARLAQLGAGQQGHRLPDRQDRRQARRRLHARRDPQRHHPRDAGVLRADDRLRGHQDPALHLREVPRRARRARPADEVGRRGDGDRPHVQGVAAEGACARWRSTRTASTTRAAARARRPARRWKRSCACPTRAACGTSPTPIAPGFSTERALRAVARSIRGSSTTSRRSSRSRDAIAAAAAGDRSTPTTLRARQAASASPTSASAQLERAPRKPIRAARRTRRHPAGLQAGRHLRRRVRGAHAVPLLDLRGRGRERRRPTRRKIMILGGGPNRIGQGIEFDYCCVHAAFALKEDGLRDHHGQLQPGDGQHRLRHLRQALLRAADARGRARTSSSASSRDGVIVQFGGQTPLKLAVPLRAGRRADPRHLARRRSTAPRTASASRRCCSKLGLQQPPNGIARSVDEAVAHRAAARLPGAGAAVLRARRPRHGDRLRRGAACAATWSAPLDASPDRPVLIDKFLDDAIELDVDAICDGDDASSIGGIMEHIERAGIHSGDSACSLPPHSIAAAGARRDPPPDDGAGARARASSA